MSFNKIYKTVYPTDRYGGNHTVGLTIEFVKLTKFIEGEENVHWSWDLILDEKRNIVIWRDEDNKGRQYDGGCYYLGKDEHGNRVLDEPIKDPDERGEIEEYLDKEWPLPKREEYIRIEQMKKDINSETLNTFEDLINEL